MDIINVAICDNSRRTADLYTRLLHKIAQKNKLQIHIIVFKSAEQLLFEISTSPNKFNILYINILLGKMDGIQLTKHIRNLYCNVEIIFFSSNPEFIFKTFEIRPLTYLDKNSISQLEFEEAFIKAVKNFNNGHNALYIIKTSFTIVKIPIREIKYFELKNRIVSVFFGNKDLYLLDDFDKIKTELASMNFHFIKTSHAFLINPIHIDRIENGRILLFSGENIPINIKYYDSIKNDFLNHLMNRPY